MPWYSRDDFYNKRRQAPKTAEGASQKTYGATWWGAQWLHALGEFDYSNRIPRGKTYANKGLVHNLAIDGSILSAQVTGSRPKPYTVHLAFVPFNASQQQRLMELVAANPHFLSKLLNRELPPELHQAALKAGISLFPQHWDELRGMCSCPDYALPCKHMAAVFFVVAHEIDKDPLMVFTLRGFDLSKELEKQGITRAGETDRDIVTIKTIQQPLGEHDPFGEVATEQQHSVDFTTLPEARLEFMQLLSERPIFFTEGDFKKILVSVYEQSAKNMDSQKVKVNIPDPSLLVAPTVYANVFLDASDGRFLNAALADESGNVLVDFNNEDTLHKFLNSFTPIQVAQSAPQLRTLHLVCRLAEELVQKSAFVPQLVQVDTHRYAVRWVPALLHEQVRLVCDAVRAASVSGVVVYVDDHDEFEPVPDDAISALTSVFVNHFVYQISGNFWKYTGWLTKWFLGGESRSFDTFESRGYPQSIEKWLSPLFLGEKAVTPVLEVHENNKGFEIRVGVLDKTKPMETPATLDALFDDARFNSVRTGVLADLSLVGEHFPDLNRLVSTRGKDQLLYNFEQFKDVFFRILPIMRLIGFQVLLPKALRKLLTPGLSMSISSTSGKIDKPGLLSLENLLRFEWQVALGDQVMSKEAFIQLAQNMRGLVRLADGYAYVDDALLEKLLNTKTAGQAPRGPQLLHIALAGEFEGQTVSIDGQLLSLLDNIRKSGEVPLPRGVAATLRPYQERGFGWLYKNTQLGFGSLLADDMGLGKTLQVLATLLKFKEEGRLNSEVKALVVAPTTLLTNWAKEAARFTPDLVVHTYHGTGRMLEPLQNADVLLTTYSVVRTELEQLNKQSWAVMVIDEAQNIKNLDAAQTKAVKKIKATVRIAMTGTPVENRLSEYYSIFDFANHGYLGSLKGFTDQFSKPIEREGDHATADRFRRITEPFLLRRVKTDKSIISDLPEKIETDQYCSLTPEQAALYQTVVQTSMEVLAGTSDSGIQRQGLVLKMLTSLKQVCNHPAHFLKQPAASVEQSGKSQRLLELLQQTLEAGEKTLVFTQYREMGILLQDMIRKNLGISPEFLHGGCSRKERDAMVDAFQGSKRPGVFLLSLKAGGTGLNLTAASNVVHYDLWWNPAVEAQATDRAYRIGQQRNVQVHRFITQGTFEEKIDKMIKSKKALAGLTVAAGEKWVGDMSDKELRELVRVG